MRKLSKAFSVMLLLALCMCVFGGGCSQKPAAPAAPEKQKETPKESAKEAAKPAFPQKPITIITHTKAGSPTDVMARQLGKAAERILGQTIVVENKPGGSGATQMAAIKAAPPDGYTLGACTPTHLGTFNTTLKGQYDVDSFSWIARVQIDPYIIVVQANSPWKSLKDLVEYAQKNPNKVRVGGYGAVGSGHNVAFSIFAEAAKIKTSWVPFEGTNDAVVALLGGHIDVANSNPGQVSQHVEAGKLRVLGVMSEKRLESMPDVPTYAEAGFPVDTSWCQFRGIFGHKDIPGDVQRILSDAFVKAMDEPGFKEYMKNTEQVDGRMGTKEFTEFIKRQDKLTKEWLEKLGVQKPS